MGSRIDGTSGKSVDQQANQELVDNLVSGGGFTDAAGADDDGKDARGAGKKGTAKGNDAAKVTAPKAPAAGGEQLERFRASPNASTINASTTGGSLSLDGDAPGKGAPAQQADVRALATQTPGVGASDDADGAAASAASSDPDTTHAEAPLAPVPRATDSDPKIAAAQQKLAKDMADPNVSQDTLRKDVKNLVDVVRAQGRGKDALKVVTNAIPVGASSKFTASIYEMAAKNGVALDNNASKSKAAVADANVAKAQRAQEKAKAEAAQQQAAAASGGSGGGGGTKAAQGGGGGGGASKWDGSKATAASTTSDTSSAGGSKQNYSGPASNFPNDTSKWASWDALWTKASGQMAGNSSAEQIGWIKEGIQAEADKTGIDPRFILAVVMQESGGNVHVGATNNGVNNPGLMQSHDGASFDGSKASVLQMIKDGVEGTSSGDGLIQGVQKTGNLFAAARLYNSGQMNEGNLSDAMGATGSYCSDLANFVMGRA